MFFCVLKGKTSVRQRTNEKRSSKNNEHNQQQQQHHHYHHHQINNDEYVQNSTVRSEKKYNYYNNNNRINLPLKTSHLLSLFVLILVVCTLVIIIEKQLPPGLKINDEKQNPNRFIAERAYGHLKNLTSLGSRIVGSYENEVLAVDLLKKEINTIINDAKEHNLIELDVQKVSGSFALQFLDGMTNAYQDLQNVVVKVGSKIQSKHSLLINCHFDTVVDSPGKFFYFFFKCN